MAGCPKPVCPEPAAGALLCKGRGPQLLGVTGHEARLAFPSSTPDANKPMVKKAGRPVRKIKLKAVATTAPRATALKGPKEAPKAAAKAVVKKGAQSAPRSGASSSRSINDSGVALRPQEKKEKKEKKAEQSARMGTKQGEEKSDMGADALQVFIT
jgi:hypothetical protein